MALIEKMKIVKRNGDVVAYNGDKIFNAIIPAMRETGVEALDINEDLINEIEGEIKAEIMMLEEMHGRYVTVEIVNDLVEDKLMSHGEHTTAKRFILYREERSKERVNLDQWKPYKSFEFLSDDFLRKYAKNPDPFDNEMSKITFYRTYSRYLPSEKRRETWLETNARVANFFIGLDPSGTIEKAEKLFDSLFNFKVASSGRVRWLSGTKLAQESFQSLFNCSYITLDNIFNLVDTMQLLMLGSGIGARMTLDDIDKLRPLRQDVEVINKRYEPVKKHDRKELTTTDLHGNIFEIIVGDSRNGWCTALRIYLEILGNYKISSNNKTIKTILFNYDNVRPEGERLKTIGGFASGATVLGDLFTVMDKTIKESKGKKISRERVKIQPIDLLDIITKIADIVRVGGTRRSAILLMLDENDYISIDAKSNLYTKQNGKWILNKDIIHRQMSNNSIAYYSKPTREKLHEAVERLKISAEPSFINMEEMQRRKEGAMGLNPLTL